MPLAVFSIAYGRTENQWQAGAIVYGILTFAIWGLTKTQLVTMISFVLPASWLLNNMIFLKGTKGFKGKCQIDYPSGNSYGNYYHAL